MNEHIFKTIEITGLSAESIEDAVRTAINRTSRSVRDMQWFEITQIKGALDSGQVSLWQATVKITFNVEES